MSERGATLVNGTFPKVDRALPKGWRRLPIDSASRRGTGHTPNQTRSDYWHGGISWVSLADSAELDKGIIFKTNKSISELGLKNSSAVLHPEGTVVMSRDAGVGKSAILGKPMATSQHFITWDVSSKGLLDKWFFYNWLQLHKRFFERMAVGSTIKTIGIPLFSKLTIDAPPLAEQRKIAEILQTWDEAIETLEAMRTAKYDQLLGTTQRLIGRGGAFPTKWPRKPLSEIVSRVRRQSDGGDHPVMTISAKSGFLLQSDKFNRDMAGQSVDRYTLLNEGEFAYNKGNSKTAPYGCIYRLDRSSALVPFVYFCFALMPGLNSDFFSHLFAAGALNHQLSRVINSGVRNDGLLNLYADDFFNLHVPVPPAPEQAHIAEILSTAKREVTLLDDEIKALQRQKRGLMQKLLTGEWRVSA